MATAGVSFSPGERFISDRYANLSGAQIARTKIVKPTACQRKLKHPSSNSHRARNPNANRSTAPVHERSVITRCLNEQAMDWSMEQEGDVGIDFLKNG